MVGIDPLPAILLLVSLLPAENTGHFVPVEIVAWIVVSPLLLSLVVPVVVLRPDVLASLLASILLVLQEELLLVVLGTASTPSSSSSCWTAWIQDVFLASSLERSSMVARQTAVFKSSVCMGCKLMSMSFC